MIFFGYIADGVVDFPDSLTFSPFIIKLWNRRYLSKVDRLVILCTLKGSGPFLNGPNQFLVILLEAFQEFIVYLIHEVVGAQADDVCIRVPVDSP